MSRYRLLPIVLVLLVVAGLQACRSGSAQRTADRAEPTPPAQLPPPPGIDAEELAPLTGEAAARAAMPLDDVLAALPQPPYLPAPGAAEEAAGERPEPPLAAQRAYLSARMAWREGKSFDAVRQLQSALRVAPNEPAILRLLGEIYTSIGNKVRGAQYLREAVQANPADVEGILWLGRYALEEGNWAEAAALFLAAKERAGADHDPALDRLVRYYLASALANDGYAEAAIGEYEAYLRGTAPLLHSSPLGSEVALLDQQGAATWQAVGDLYHQLGRPKDALRAYERALDAQPANRVGLVKRLLYTQLKLGRAEDARALALRQIGHAQPDAATLQLIRYVADHGGESEAFARHLREVYEREERPTSLALAVADLLPPAAARSMLIDHLAHRPNDEQALNLLMRQHLLPEGAGQASEPRIAAAIDATAQLVEAAPEQADDFVAALLRAAHDSAAVARVAASLPAEKRQRTAYRLIHSLALATSGDIDAALAELERVLKADPQSQGARVQLAKLYIARREAEKAARVLEPLADSRDPGVVALRVHVLSETGRSEEALALLDAIIAGGSGDVSLILQKANLQLAAGEAAAAERTLLDALNVQPQEERLYEALLNLYDPRGGSSPIADSQRQWNRLVRRLLGTIPYSRIGRLVRAQIHDAKGELPQAEALLKELLAEDPHDAQAMRDLLALYVRSNRREEALALLERQIQAHPKDPQTLLAAGLFYKQLGEHEKMLDAVERYLLLSSPSEERDTALATFYVEREEYAKAVEAAERALAGDDVQNPRAALDALGRALAKQGRLAEAEKRYERAIERFEGQAADLAYDRAALVSRSGDRERAEKLMLDLLERHPDHAPTNNDLGYQWVVQDKNLERAKAMIQTAADAEPQSAAYLDSLGWVHYKLGQFEEAETWLRRARQALGGSNPVIVDHLGDALYRLDQRQEAVKAWEEARSVLQNGLPVVLEHQGNRAYQRGDVAEAVQYWRQARELQQGQSPWEDPEMRDLGERLTAKIEAVRDDRRPPITLLPNEPPTPSIAPAEEPAEAPEEGLFDGVAPVEP